MYDVPGRTGNLYKDSLGSTMSGILEDPPETNSVRTICRTQPAAEDFGCFNAAGLDKIDLIPPRRIQYDDAIERQLHRGRPQEFPIMILLVVLLLVWLLSQ